VAKKDDSQARGKKEPKDSNPSREPSSKEGLESKGIKKAEVATATSGNKVSDFLQGTREELDKVVWPSRQQLISESLAVILMVTLSATLIYLVDNLFSWAAKQVF
jgi:preprotein translocase subunit SecE